MCPQQRAADPGYDTAMSTGHTGSEQCSVIGRVAGVQLAVPNVDGDIDLVQDERPPPHGQDRVASVTSRTLNKTLVQGPAVGNREIGILIHSKVALRTPGDDHVPHRIRAEAREDLFGADRVVLSPLDEATQIRRQSGSELRRGNLIRARDDSQCGSDTLLSTGESERRTL
ncbi:hypothetical protein YWIDRAFT_06533 [Streptomyces sp. SceaMP-e96]|nr:hypothetical protein YWIDRAFT_06533 [Streptomyces sp. SceaMP-e96]